MTERIIVVSGGFDPLHSGHIAYFQSAKSLGDKLIVALNSDEWLLRKKESFFMPFDERKTIIENLLMVDMVIDFEDDEEGSCSSALEKIKETYPNNIVTFCNGGDRNKENIPEMKVSGIEFKFGVGGSDKKNSSSWILKDYKYPFEERSWGKFYNLFSDKKDIGVKIKELIVFPKQELSFQRHFHRSEIWFVSSGKCIVNYSEDKPEDANKIELSQEDNLCIQKEAWHQIINPFEEACHIIEIQYGDKTVEEDIEREVI